MAQQLLNEFLEEIITNERMKLEVTDIRYTCDDKYPLLSLLKNSILSWPKLITLCPGTHVGRALIDFLITEHLFVETRPPNISNNNTSNINTLNQDRTPPIPIVYFGNDCFNLKEEVSYYLPQV